MVLLVLENSLKFLFRGILVQPYIPFHIAPEYVAHFYGIIFTLVCNVLFYAWRHAQHCVGRFDQVYYYDGWLHCHCCNCNDNICMAIAAILNVPEGWGNPFFGWHLNLDWTKYYTRCQ